MGVSLQQVRVAVSSLQNRGWTTCRSPRSDGASVYGAHRPMRSLIFYRVVRAFSVSLWDASGVRSRVSR